MERKLALAPIVYAHDPAAPKADEVLASVIRTLVARREIAEGGLTWSFPSSLLERDQGELSETMQLIRERVEAGQDRVAPCGYSAAHHGALLGVELERELTWGIRNSWGSGVRTRFDLKENILFSTRIDLAREQALPRYTREYGTMIAGLQQGGNVPLYDLAVYDGTSLRRMPAADLSSVRLGRRGAIRSLVRAIRRSRQTFVAVLIPAERLADELCVERFFRLLDLLRRHRSLTITPFGTEIVSQCEPDYHAVPEIQPAAEPRMTPDLLRTAHSVAACRTGRTTADSTRRILTSVSREQAPVVDPPTVDHEPREYIASMIGVATIADEAMAASFDSGLLCGISADDGELLTGESIPGWVETERRRHNFLVNSAFSFETEHSRGLSTYATTDDMAGAAGVRMDALFVTDFPWLIIDMQVTTPRPTRRTLSMSPFVLPITECTGGQCIEVESIYPDGEAAMSYIEATGDEQITTVWGSVMRLRWNDRVLSLGFPAFRGKTTAPVTLRLVRTGRRRFRAEVHPAGFFRACGSEQLTGRAYGLTFCIAPGEPDANPVLRPPDLIRRCLLPSESHHAAYPRIT